MYAMRYGTIPIVRYTGGLKDTVKDISPLVVTVLIILFGVDDAVHFAIKRALYVYMDEELMKNLRNVMMNLDFLGKILRKNT